MAARQLYGGSLTKMRHTFGRLGWRASFVDVTDVDAVAAAIEPQTKAVFVESLANPAVSSPTWRPWRTSRTSRRSR